MRKHLIAALLFIFPVFTYLSAQNGYVTGKVIDESTGEELIGVSVVVKGTTNGVATDIDGSYKLELAPGTYDLQVSYISYQSKVVTGVVVKAKQSTTLDIILSTAATDLGEIVIETKANRETNTALVLEQKNSAVLFDGISVEMIKKTPDRNTADVLKRVSGATVQDNFVIIRGLPDRYNAAFLNGSPLPSSEPDRKAFSFDIFPSALLNDLKVIKTAMPSLPGEFAGGLIQIKTKDIPESNYYNLSIGATFDLLTTFKDYHSAQGGNVDFLGIDDGTRTLPGGIPDNATYTSLPKDSLLFYTKQFPNTYNIKKGLAGPGANFQYSMGHNVNLIPKARREALSGQKREFGSVFALTYNSRVMYRNVERNDYEEANRTIHYNDDQYNNTVTWGGLWNLAFLFSKSNGSNTRITLKNMFNINSNNQYIYREGANTPDGFEIKAYNMYYSQNMLIASQLSGEHVLPVNKTKLKFEWSAGYNRLNRIIPDYRITEYRRTLGDSTGTYHVPFSTNVQPTLAGRFYSSQTDNTYSGTFDFTWPFKIGKAQQEFKTGAFFLYKDREFEARQFGYASYKSTASQIGAISAMNIDSIFIASNFNQNGLVMKEITKKSDSYLASQGLIAAYLQLENSMFKNKLKFVWGLRMESFHQVIEAYDFSTGAPVRVDTNKIDFLPSLNIIYSINEKMNLRLSGSQTVCRPESRELAPFTFYDYSLFASVTGNPQLQRTRITNADLRYEWYPAGGQLISVTGFFKYFENPIEKILYPAGSVRYFSYLNVPTAYTAGAELEFRFTIGSFIKGEHSRVLDDLTLLGNFSYIYSEVNLDSVAGVQERRPLQGQSPYIINAGISYNDSKYDFGITTMFNYVGPRIFTVGNVLYPSIWENPRLVWDLQLIKYFMKKKLEIRVNFRDLLAPVAYYFQDNDGNRVFDPNVDNTMIARNMGQQISINLGYKF